MVSVRGPSSGSVKVTAPIDLVDWIVVLVVLCSRTALGPDGTLMVIIDLVVKEFGVGTCYALLSPLL